MKKNRGESVQKLEELLEKSKNDQGDDLYKHMLKVMGHLIASDPANAVDRFEEISFALKVKGELAQEGDMWQYKQLAQDLKDWMDFCKKEYFELKKAGDEGDEEVQETATLGNIPDLLSERKMFEWAGIGFSEEDTFLLMKSLKKLAQTVEAKSLRFWGKIYGREQDYYIAEGQIEGGAEEEGLPEDQEGKGTGVNQFTYWVCNKIGGEWTSLPDVNPTQIKLARMIKHVFTGVLNSKVITNPFFKGEEKHLLRAQIARITHSTTLIPKGIHKVVEEEEGKKGREIEMEEEPKMPTYQTTQDLDNWLHYLPSILDCGRITHLPPQQEEGAEEVDPEELQKRIEAKDPFEDRLKPVSIDVPFQSYPKSWSIKTLGDLTSYKEESLKPGATTCYAVHVIQSLLWPGSCTVFQGGKWSSMYIGYGLKCDEKKYYPIYPPEVNADPEGPLEHEEPNPKDLPEEEEKKEGEEGGEEGEGQEEEEENQ